jgi:AraC family transcriptional regulator, melibiose operon regulatory protein
LPNAITQGLFEGGVLTESDYKTERSRVDLWVDQLNSTSKPERQATQLELHAAFLRMTPKSLAPNWEVNLPTDVTPVIGICRYVAMHLRNPLTSVEIAAAVNLHPNYAARLFRRLTGMGIQDYVMQQRVAATQRLLITTQDAVEQIGIESGFQSQSQFFASFKKATGQTPLQYRKLNLKLAVAK